MSTRVPEDRKHGWLRAAALSSIGTLVLTTGAAVAQVPPDTASQDERQQETAQMEEDGLFGGEQRLDPNAPLAEATVGALHGSTVVNEQNEEIGSIRDIVLHREDYKPHAIVDVGGWLGIGGTQIAVPLNELEIRAEDEVAYLTPATRDQIEQQAEDYDRDRFISHGDNAMPLAVYLDAEQMAAQQSEGEVAAAEEEQQAASGRQAGGENRRETTTTE